MLTDEQKAYILEQYQIPVDDMGTSECWVIVIAEESAMPTDKELQQLELFRWLLMRFMQKSTSLLLKREGHIATIFLKRGDDDWCFRRQSWLTGPIPPPEEEPFTLEDVLDHQWFSQNVVWDDLKSQCPDLFRP